MTDYTPGEKWEEHYRGYELRIHSDGQIWWQVYQGTDRLHLEPHPAEIVDQFLELKPLGGRVRVTEGGAVITRKEDEGASGGRGQQSLDDYTPIYVGELDLDGDLVPAEASEYEVPVRPTGLSSGDLWPSVYDGARYSFSMNGNAWWHNPRSKKRHPLSTELAADVRAALTRHKPEGGSFRVTPWGDVVTLVRSPASQTVRDQFGDLPRVVQNIIKLRRERADLQMVPIYVDSLTDLPLEVDKPPSLSDKLSEAEREELEGWAASLGSTTFTSADAHRVNSPNPSTEKETTDETPAESTTTSGDDSAPSESDVDPLPDDDPVAWLDQDMDNTEKRINDR